MKIDLIAGARPNFMKVAPIIDEIKNVRSKGKNIDYRFIHTGQHYDKNMSSSLIRQLGMPSPDINLDAGGGSQAEQTAKIMIGYESLLRKKSPDFCLVVGDVTSTMSCSIVAKKANIKLIHVEAGIRSWDLSMPEEINRIITDSIADYFFTTSKIANENLKNVGIEEEKIFYVGNTMIDTLIKFKDKLIRPCIWDKLSLRKKKYIVMTLHRPSNIDDKIRLRRIVNEVHKSLDDIPIVFAAHPRTLKQIEAIRFKLPNLHVIQPLSYLEFNYLVKSSMGVITDSGGITEETTIMKIPCMTLRDSTERPETVSIGTNELIGLSYKAIRPAIKKLILGKWKKGDTPPLWDGKASERIIQCIIKLNYSL